MTSVCASIGGHGNVLEFLFFLREVFLCPSSSVLSSQDDLVVGTSITYNSDSLLADMEMHLEERHEQITEEVEDWLEDLGYEVDRKKMCVGGDVRGAVAIWVGGGGGGAFG